MKIKTKMVKQQRRQQQQNKKQSCSNRVFKTLNWKQNKIFPADVNVDVDVVDHNKKNYQNNDQLRNFNAQWRLLWPLCHRMMNK